MIDLYTDIAARIWAIWPPYSFLLGATVGYALWCLCYGLRSSRRR